MLGLGTSVGYFVETVPRFMLDVLSGRKFGCNNAPFVACTSPTRRAVSSSHVYIYPCERRRTVRLFGLMRPSTRKPRSRAAFVDARLRDVACLVKRGMFRLIPLRGNDNASADRLVMPFG